MNRERAKTLLVHYMRLAVKANGGAWSWDNESEVENIVDCIIDAAKEEVVSAIRPEPAATIGRKDAS